MMMTESTWWFARSIEKWVTTRLRLAAEERNAGKFLPNVKEIVPFRTNDWKYWNYSRRQRGERIFCSLPIHLQVCWSNVQVNLQRSFPTISNPMHVRMQLERASKLQKVDNQQDPKHRLDTTTTFTSFMAAPPISAPTKPVTKHQLLCRVVPVDDNDSV